MTGKHCGNCVQGIQTPDIAVWARLPDYTTIKGKRTTYKNHDPLTVLVTYVMRLLNEPQVGS